MINREARKVRKEIYEFFALLAFFAVQTIPWIRTMNSPRFFFILGSILLLVGWIIPLLILMKMIESTFLLNFFGWSASVAGLFLGFLGGAMWVKMNKED